MIAVRLDERVRHAHAAHRSHNGVKCSVCPTCKIALCLRAVSRSARAVWLLGRERLFNEHGEASLQQRFCHLLVHDGRHRDANRLHAIQQGLHESICLRLKLFGQIAGARRVEIDDAEQFRVGQFVIDCACGAGPCGLCR